MVEWLVHCMSVLGSSPTVGRFLSNPTKIFDLFVSVCLGASCFMIYNAAESLCLQDSLRDARVDLGRCSVDSDLQQWLWIETWFLMNVGTRRCLSAHHNNPIQMVECDGGDHLHWNCLNHRLISVNRSLELGTEGGKLVLTNSGKKTKWKSLDEGNICQDKLSKSYCHHTVIVVFSFFKIKV